ncbi:MAG: phosphate ABC transporter substrate-binding protein [Chthonomonadales bacterium]|nr:phosphate ABC transporter substrate-binding protein [Chthonomonadales bacterium]
MGQAFGLRATLIGALGAAIGLSGCAKPEPGSSSTARLGPTSAASLQIKGSDTLVQLAQVWAEAFVRSHRAATVTVTGGGSNTGIMALIHGGADICNSSRPIAPSETAAARARGVEPTEFVVARDALAIVVHPGNPITDLTLAQLKRIFTARVTNWRELGGHDEAIVINSRETTAGTYVFFQEHVLDSERYAVTALLLPSSSEIVRNVAQDRGGIGYVGIGYVSDQVRIIRLRRDAASPAVAPNARNVRNGTYPLARPLFEYAAGDPTKIERMWLDWVMGPEGQAIVARLGFVPVRWSGG